MIFLLFSYNFVSSLQCLLAIRISFNGRTLSEVIQKSKSTIDFSQILSLSSSSPLLFPPHFFAHAPLPPPPPTHSNKMQRRGKRINYAEVESDEDLDDQEKQLERIKREDNGKKKGGDTYGTTRKSPLSI